MKKNKFKYGLKDWTKPLEQNWKSGIYNGFEYGYTSPAESYNRVQCFLMDSCPNSFLWAKHDIEKAKNEIRTLLHFLNVSGLPPMIIYLVKEDPARRALEWLVWRRYVSPNPPATELTQPPGTAESVLEVYNKSGDISFLNEVAPALKKMYKYFAENRDPDKDGLVSLIHPYESMTDSTPEFDKPIYSKWQNIPYGHFIANYLLYRKFKKTKWDINKALEIFDFESPYFNTIYALNLQALSEILKIIEDDEFKYFQDLAIKTTDALVKKCFNKKTGLFQSLYGKNETMTTEKTISGLMPIVLNIPKECVESLIKNIKDPGEFYTPYPIPSVAVSEPTFTPEATRYLWRGTTWVITNWYLVRGLIKHGYVELAKDIVFRNKNMIDKSGFREYYNPITGEGYGAREDGWSALIVDMLDQVERI